MRKCISELIKKIGLSLQEDDYPSEEDIKKVNYTIENPVTSLDADPKAKLSVPGSNPGVSGDGSKSSTAKPVSEESDNVRKSKRPNVKPPRREESFKAKWKGVGKKEVRNEYQKEYRSEHGNK